MPRELLMMQNNYEWGTAEGQTLEIENAIRSNVRDLKIEGQTYQNLSGVSTAESSENKFYKYEKITGIKPSTTYTWIFDIKSENTLTTGNVTEIVRIDLTKEDGNQSIPCGFTGTVTNVFQRVKLKFTTPSANIKFIEFNLRNQFNVIDSSLTSNTITIKNNMLLEGDYTNTDLPILINGIESVAERERNLANYIINVIGTLGKKVVFDNKNCLKITSTFSRRITLPDFSDYKIYMCVYGNNPENKIYSIGEFNGIYISPGNKKWQSNTLTANLNKFSLYNYQNTEIYIDIDSLILERVVNPYPLKLKINEENNYINLPIPLRSLPNGVRDTVEGNKLIQRVGKIVVDGTNNISIYSIRENTIGLFMTDVTIKNVKGDSDLPFLSDSLEKIRTCWKNDIEGVYQDWTKNRFFISISKSKLAGTTLNDIKSYFAENPMTLYYELVTPIEHTINVPRIPIRKGGNIVTTTNNIKPNLNIKYKKIPTTLYNLGNECTELTGGYLTASNNTSNCNVEKQVDNLYINCTGKTNFDSICYARTNKRIKPCKIKVSVKNNSISANGIAFCVFLSEKEAINSVRDFESVVNKKYIKASNTTQGQYVNLEMDLTNNARGYLYILCMVAGSSYVCNANINKIKIIE